MPVRFTPVGQMTERVRVYQQASNATPNADGQVEEDAELYATRWAKVEPLRGNERFAAQQVQADVAYRVRMPSDPTTRAITPEMWLLLSNDTRLNITAAYDVDDRNIEIELLCTERT